MNRIAFPLLFSFLLFTRMSCEYSPEKMVAYPAEIELENELIPGPLTEILANKRIIALGESSHGLGELYKLKSQLVEHLHNELDFDVIAIEGGLGDINLAWFNADTMNATQLQENSIFSNFSSKEIKPMFELLIDQKGKPNELIYTGFDSQFSSGYFEKSLASVLERYQPGLIPTFNEYEDHFYKWYQCGMQSDSLCYNDHQNSIALFSDEVAELLQNNKSELAKDLEGNELAVEIMIRTLQGMKKATSVSYEERWQAIQKRDEVMFENLVWLIDTVYPKKKFIVWAHNAHVENKPCENAYYTWMGHLMKEKYQDDYYSIGMFAYEGEAYIHWTGESMAFENSSEAHLESHLEKYNFNTLFYPISDLDSSILPAFIHESVLAKEFENGDTVRFIPSERFDALIQVDYSGIPTYK